MTNPIVRALLTVALILVALLTFRAYETRQPAPAYAVIVNGYTLTTPTMRRHHTTVDLWEQTATMAAAAHVKATILAPFEANRPKFVFRNHR